MEDEEYPLHSESFELLKELVENKCINYDTPDSGHEMRSVKTLSNYFESKGISNYEIFEPSKGRGNILLRIKGKNPESSSLMYQSHLDVVPSSENWAHDPYSCEIRDGWIWGRGTLDMLMFTATQATAIAELITSGYKPEGDLIFLAVADEEGGGQYGAKWLVDNVPEKIKADYLISEFGGAILTDLSGKKKIALMNAEKSPGWTRLSISGEPGHASVPYKSKNTIFMASQIIENIRKSPPEIVITNAYQEFLTGLDLSWLQNKLLTTPFTIDFTLNKLANENPAAASTLHALTRMTVTPTKMTAGNKTNIIPDELTIDFDIRLLPDQDWDYIKNYFNSVIPKEFSDNTKLSKILVDATTADSFDTPLVEAMTDLTNQLIPGYPVVPLFLPAVTDARVFRKLGITCYGYCLLGERMPTDLISKLAHGDDERIPVESLQLSHEFFKLLPEFFWKQ